MAVKDAYRAGRWVLAVAALSMLLANSEFARAAERFAPSSRRLADSPRELTDRGVQPASLQLNDDGGELRSLPRVPAELPEVPAEVPEISTPTAELSDRVSERLPALDATGDACESCNTCDTVVGCASVNCDSCVAACPPCRPNPLRGWLDHSEFFIAADGWKNNFDDDDNNNFGFRAGANLGFDLLPDRPLRGQIGASYGAYDFHGREELLSRDDPIEQQLFATAGIYRRSDVACGDCIAWGAVYDLLVADEAGERADGLRLGQVRTYVGYAVSRNDEVGAWAAMRMMNDFATAQAVKVNATDQANLFWHHTWATGGDTTAYAGWADDPGSVVIGLNGRVPLNNHVALFGNLQYIVPSTTGGDFHPTLPVDDTFNQESWNISFGLVFFPGGKAGSPNVSGHRGLPLLPVADNASFSYQANMF